MTRIQDGRLHQGAYLHHLKSRRDAAPDCLNPEPDTGPETKNCQPEFQITIYCRIFLKYAIKTVFNPAK